MAPPRVEVELVDAVPARVDALARLDWLRAEHVVVGGSTRRPSPVVALVALALVVVALVGVVSADDGLELDAGALAATGFELQQQGRMVEAAEAYRAAVAIDPSNAVAHFNLGVLHHQTGATVDAALRYEAALAADPQHVPSLFNLALLRAGQADPDRAIDLYRRVLAVEPQHASASLNLGVLLLERGEVVEGTELIDRAVALNPALQLP
jgi:tetratricopeptide (TPR) repeat protein